MTACSVVGLGKLGSSMAAAIAARGVPVIGVDVEERAVDAVNAGEAPVYETDLATTIAANRERLRATTSVIEADPPRRLDATVHELAALGLYFLAREAPAGDLTSDTR